jgi:hypothetical protein
MMYEIPQTEVTDCNGVPFTPKPRPRRMTIGDAITISAFLFALLTCTVGTVLWFLVLTVIGALWLMGVLG